MSKAVGSGERNREAIAGASIFKIFWERECFLYNTYNIYTNMENVESIAKNMKT
jgi:hypothetical protein